MDKPDLSVRQEFKRLNCSEDKASLSHKAKEKAPHQGPSVKESTPAVIPKPAPHEGASVKESTPAVIPKPRLASPQGIITGDTRLIIFDLECTGLIRGPHYPHITQWCAKDYASGELFATYVKPKIPITQKAQEITTISCTRGNMTYNGKPVVSITLPEAVDRFMEYVGDRQCVLCAHNGKRFDFPVLVKSLTAIGKLDTFLAKVVGFADTIHVFRDKLPGRASYAEGNLVADILTEPFNAHNAIDDVEALVKVMRKVDITRRDFSTRVLSPDVVHADMAKKTHIESLKRLVNEEICSKNMIDTMAASGLDLQQLKEIYEKSGEEGLRETFVSPATDGKPRVTGHKATLSRVLPKLSAYLSKDKV